MTDRNTEDMPSAASQAFPPVAGEQIPWDGIDEDTSIKIGILSELTAIREQLQRIADAQGGKQVQEQPDEPYFCTVCKERFTKDEARKHAINEHNAPPDLDDWKAPFEIRT